jgi:hypothetical protein
MDKVHGYLIRIEELIAAESKRLAERRRPGFLRLVVSNDNGPAATP